ncbi:unnamed protein product [Peronospora destructor]|uniref:Serine carboxypeptidase n=1 Tax=Peronospora destructor TaxID=86335 RepID=A0AAV0SZ76_9STRA|nr:unnamed protein product [Peronospora destructor]
MNPNRYNLTLLLDAAEQQMKFHSVNTKTRQRYIHQFWTLVNVFPGARCRHAERWAPSALFLETPASCATGSAIEHGRWISLNWQDKADYNAAEERMFVAHDPLLPAGRDINAGVVRLLKNFAFVRVFGAGHMMPKDQSAVSLDLINRFFADEAL